MPSLPPPHPPQRADRFRVRKASSHFISLLLLTVLIMNDSLLLKNKESVALESSWCFLDGKFNYFSMVCNLFVGTQKRWAWSTVETLRFKTTTRDDDVKTKYSKRMTGQKSCRILSILCLEQVSTLLLTLFAKYTFSRLEIHDVLFSV